MRFFDEHTERLLRQSLMDAERATERLQGQIDQLIASNRDLSALLLTSERRRGELVKLVVAFRRLVEATDATAALRAVEEILVAIVGTENFVIIANAGRSGAEAVAGLGRVNDLANTAPLGLDEVASCQNSREAHAAAVRWIDTTIVTAMPLKIGDHVVGAIVIGSLLPHKEGLSADDDQVLCLLGGFAATSIMASEQRRGWKQLNVPQVS
jgi:hypothetical protein